MTLDALLDEREAQRARDGGDANRAGGVRARKHLISAYGLDVTVASPTSPKSIFGVKPPFSRRDEMNRSTTKARDQSPSKPVWRFSRLDHGMRLKHSSSTSQRAARKCTALSPTRLLRSGCATPRGHCARRGHPLGGIAAIMRRASSPRCRIRRSPSPGWGAAARRDSVQSDAESRALVVTLAHAGIGRGSVGHHRRNRRGWRGWPR
jgi:hypothetical protein